MTSAHRTRLEQTLATLEATQRRRDRRRVEAVSATECLVDGRRCISFSTNDYLGLTRHPAVIEAYSRGASIQFGAGASQLIAGRSPWHEHLEADLAVFESTEAAILFPSGFAANFGTLTSLIDARDAVFCDRDNHASLIDGSRASAGKFFVYDRTDLDRLRESIRQRRSDFDGVWIVTDSVYSMDGILANLTGLCDIADECGAWVVVDEAHATGVFGESGRGVCERQGVEDRVTVRIGTLSKTIGGLGGFVAGTRQLCDVLWNTARTQFFSTALPPAVCAAASASLAVIRSEPERRTRLNERSQVARQLLLAAGLNVISTGEATESPIIGIQLESESQAMTTSDRLHGRGFLIPAIRPPTVPAGTSRLRMSISSEHSTEQIRAAVDSICASV